MSARRIDPIRSALLCTGAIALAGLCVCAFASAAIAMEAAEGDPEAEVVAVATEEAVATEGVEVVEEGDLDVEVVVEPGGDATLAGRPRGQGPRLRRLHDSGGFPPIGMRLDLPQDKGHWTFTYRYVRALDEGLGDDRNSVDPSELLGAPYDYTRVPTKQVSQMHVVGVAYAPLERLTFELSLPYLNLQQDLLTASGNVSTSSSGIGDARFVFIVPFIENGDQATDLTLGFTFPTGGIEQNDASGNRLPYSMQLGSGTWDLIWGITYTGREGRLGWGGEIDGVYRIGENALGYTQSTVYEASAWLTATVHEWLTLTGRLGWSRHTNVSGADPDLDASTNPDNDPMKQAWNRLEMGPGANIYLPVLGGQRFAVEAMFPVLQVLSGPQLEREWTLTAGFQWLY